jgi:hypothetical protein
MYDLENAVDIDDLKDLLSYVSEYDVYAYYIGSQFQVGKVMRSPLRKDDHPSFGVFKSSTSGDLLWKDQATGKTGNVVQFVAELFHISTKEALCMITDNIKSGKIALSEKGLSFKHSFSRTKTIISIQRKNFSEIDDEFWEKYFITRDLLKKHKVYPIHTFWVNDVISNLFYMKDKPLYAYAVYDKFQIYSPYGSRKDKFRTNCTKYDIHGFELLPKYGDLLIITKSKKDIMVLDRLGYTAIAPTGETTPIPKDVMDDLKQRFKRIVILYDNDEPGINGAKKLSVTNGIEFTYIPIEYYTKFKIKDVSDFIKAYKITKTRQLLKTILNEKD